MKQKIITIALIILMGAALIVASSSFVKGQGQSPGLYIWNVVSQGGINEITSGNVSQAVTVQATLYQSNGPYLVYFGDKLVDNSTSTGFYVASNFTIPEVTAGTYTITLTDVTFNMNTTKNFTVNVAYVVQPVILESPEQLQEGADVVLNVSITGGTPNTSHTANITVQPPAPLTNLYSQLVSLTTSASGTANTQITFPSSSFSPSGSTTIYAGTYTAYFNQTASLGQSSFTLGITDKTEYHRQETVTINAVGYQAGQTATLTIKNEADTAILTRTITASPQGVVHTTWDIPSTTALGTYNVTITPQGTAKAIVDSQTFTLFGYPVTFRALNLAGGIVPDILIQVHDADNGLYYNATTRALGFATINLEAGTYTVSAYWNDVKVGEREISLTGTSNFDVTCKLTNLQVSVKTAQGSQQVVVPYVDLAITIKYGSGASQTSTVIGQTDISGKFTLNSTLPNAQYTIEASKYNTVFNTGNDTVNNMPEQPSYQVTIVCPTRSLSIKTVDSNYADLPNVRIELVEQGSGIFYRVTTDNSGTAQLQVVFGQYRAKVFTTDNSLLNETTINVFSNTQSQIRCALYDLKITVKVVDYFGNPMSNVNVQISRSGTSMGIVVTQNDGIATFDSIVGGDYIVTAYLTGNDNSHVSTSIQVTSPATVQLSMANFVSLGGMVMGVSMLATIIILAIVIVPLAVIVIYKRSGRKLHLK